MTRPSAIARTRRNQLLARSALAGLGIAVAIGATPALAQATGVGTIDSTTSNGGAVGVVDGVGVTDITTNASRSIVNWTSLNVTSAEALNFYFNNRKDIVVNRVAGSASIDGVLNGCMATCGDTGGNIWILSASGVVIGANAQISTGGFLAATGDLTDADILDGDMNFAFSGYDEGTISVAAGAAINTNGGSIALIAPTINTAAGSTVTASGAGNVLYGSATNYNVTFAPTVGDDLDLISFQVPTGADGAGGLYGGSMLLYGATTGNRVYAAVVSKAGLTSTLLATGAITATSVGTDETGAIILSNNRSIVGGAVSGAVAGAATAGTVTNHGVLTALDVTLAASGALLFSGDINAGGGDVILTSDTGTVHQNSGVITADTLTASAATDIVLDAGWTGVPNDVAKINGLSSASGAIGYSGTSFEIVGPITTPGIVGLSTTGVFSGAGTISAGSISLLGAGAINVLGDANLLFSESTGDLTIHATGGIAMTDGWRLYGHQLTLIADAGSILQTNDAIYNGGSLVATATGDIDFGFANDVTSFTGNTSSGDVTFRGEGNVSVGASSAGGTLSLISDTGAITQTGAILTSTLTASASSGINLANPNNAVSNIGGLSNSGLGDIVYGQNDGFQITGALTTANGGMSLTSTNGSITQTASGIITTSLLNANAGDDLILDQANVVGVVGNLTAGGGAGDDLVFNSTLGFAINGLVGGDDVTLTSDGSITQGALSTLTANTLTVGAAGGIELYYGVNNVATIGGLSSTSGDIVYRDVNGFDIQGNITANSTVNNGVMLVAGGTGAITQTSGILDVGYFRGIAGTGITLGGANLIRRLISSQVNNGALALNTTTDLSVDGTVVANTVSLTSTGAITQANNAQIWTTTLNASAVTGVNLTASGSGANNIGNLGVITNTTSGGVTIANANPTMNLTGNITAAGQAVSISNSMGGINQTGGIITADNLTASAGASITLGQANAVTTLGDVTAGGTGSVAFVNSGDVELSGDIASGTGGVVSITSTNGAIDQTSGTLSADWIKLNAGTTISQGGGATFTSFGLSLASGGNVSLGQANNFTSINDLAVGGDLTLRNLGSIDLGPVLSGFYSSGGALTLTSDTGNIVSTTGGIVTSRLTATAAGFISLDGTIASLGDVTAGGNILLTTYSGGMDLTGDVTGQTVSLYADTGVSQSGGKLDVSRLNVITSGAITLTGANEIDVVGRLETDQFSSGAGANITLRNVGDIVLDYLLNAPGATVSLTSDTGGISQTSLSAITAGTLTLDAAGGIDLANFAVGTGNDIDALGLVTAGGAVSIGSVLALDLTDDIDTDGNNLSLFSQLGLTQSGGVLKASILTTSVSTGSITLNRANEISALGIMFAGGLGDITFRNSGSFALTGVIDVFGNNLTLISNSGGIVQQLGGEITAANLNATAAGGLILDQANNVVALGGLTTTTGDITFRNTGNIAAPALTTPGTLTLISDLGAITQTGAITADTLTAQAAAGVTLMTASNNVANLGLLSSSSGGIRYTDADGFNLTQNITAAGQTVSLVANGSGQIEQTGGIVTANVLNLAAGGRIWVNNANAVGSLGTVTAGGHILFRNAGNTVVGGDITAAGFDVTLRSNNGSITQTAGSDITSQYLQLIAQTGISLTNAGNAVGELAWLQNNTGGVAFGQTGGFTVSYVQAIGQTVSLTSLAGAITQNAGWSIVAGTLNASAAGTLTLNEGANVDNLGVISTGGSFLFRDYDGFDITGNVTAASQVVMLAQGGSIEQTGGIITAADINAMASGDILLGGANVIGAISSLSAGGDLLYRQVGDLSMPSTTAGGSMSLYSTTGSITQTGVLSGTTLNAGAATGITLDNVNNSFAALGDLANTTSGAISIRDADGFDLTGAITTGAGLSVSLTAVSGAITQQTGATIETDALSLSATTGATLDGDNDINLLGPITVGGVFTFNDVDGFDIAGTLDAGTANLTSGGAITQGAGVLTVGTLSLTAASVTLNGANDIDYLADVYVTGNMNFADVDGIRLDGAQTVDGILALTAVAFVIQDGGGLDVGRLEIDAGTAVAINMSGNSIDVLGDVSSTSDSIAIVNSGSGALLVDGDVFAAAGSQSVYITSGSGVTMTTAASITAGAGIELRGGDVVVGDINAGGTLRVVAAGGSVSSIAAPTIVAAGLTGSATGSFILTGANIDINSIGYMEIGDTFSITGNNGPLTLSNNIIADTVILATTGAMTQIGGSLDATTGSFSAGGDLTLGTNNSVDTVSLNGANVTFNNTASFAANVITSAGAVSLTSANGKITQTPSTGRIVADSLTASAATGLEFFGGQNDIAELRGLSSTSGGVTYRDWGGFEITGNITAVGQSVELVSDGTGADGDDIVQTGGIITASRIDGTSAGDFLLDQANVVGSVGVLNAGGDLTYRGAGALTLIGNLTAGDAVTLTANSGAIMQNGGVITATRLNASSTTGIGMSRLNDVDELGDIAGDVGEFSFRDINDLDLVGDITAGYGIILQTGGTGDLTQSGGSLTTASLQAFSNGSIDLTGPSNDVDTLSGFAVNNFAFADINSFDIDANLYAGQTMTLAATGGGISQSAGLLTATTLNASAAWDVNLTLFNAVTTLGNLSAGGRVYFANTDGFSIAGDIAATTVVLISDAGAITQTGGTITGGELAVDAEGAVTLDQAGNDFDVITSILSGGDLTYRDVDSVNLSGWIGTAGVATFNVGGDLIQTVGVFGAARVQGSAGGAFAIDGGLNNVGEIGPITADRIALVTAGGLTIVGDLVATTGVELKADDFITQATGATITGATLRAQADGDIILDQANDLDSITLLYSDFGDVTYADVDGFSLDASSIGDFWSSGTFTLTAGGTGGITQSGAGLRAGTLLVNAGGNVTLDQTNRIDLIGASSAGGSVFQVVNLGDLEIAGDISVAGALGDVELTSQTGKVEQTSGEIDAYTVGGASVGDFILTNFTGALGDITTTAGDIDVSNAGDIVLFGLLHTDNADSVTLTSTAGSIGHGIGRIETGTLNLDAAIGIALDGAQSNDVERLGTVSSYSNFAFRNDDSFDLSGDVDVTMIGGGVVLTADSGAITQSGGVITAYGLTLQAVTGLDLTSANMVSQLSLTNSGVGDVYVFNGKTISVGTANNTDGLVEIGTTAGDIVVTTGIEAATIRLISAADIDAAYLEATGDVLVDATNGDATVDLLVVGDDATVQAVNGSARVGTATLLGFSDNEGNGQTLVIAAGSGDATLGAEDEASITAGADLTRVSGAGGVFVSSLSGDASAFIDSTNTRVSLTATNGAATYVAATGDLLAGSVSGANVLLKALNGMVDATSVTVGGGDYSLYGEDFSTGAITVSGTARDRTITDTAGDLELFTNVVAQRDLTISAQGSVLNGTGSVNIGAGLGGQGDLSITAASIAAYFVAGYGNITLTALSGSIDIGTVLVAGDYTVTGAGFSSGTLTPLGGKAGTWSLTALGGLDFTGLTLSYRGDIDIQAADSITGGNVRSINGSVTINGPDAIDVEGLYAAIDVSVTSGSDVTIDTADAYGGDVTLNGQSVTVEGYADAAGDVTAIAGNGTADVNAATAGGDITVQATDGDAILGAASLTGTTGDLLVTADNGDVIFGVLDYTTVSSDNVFSRAAGSTGTATLISSTGDVTANLWSSARIDVVQAAIDAEVSTETGDLEIGQLLSAGGEVYAEAVDGDLTIDEALAQSGFLGLYASGDLTILDTAYGDAGVEIETGGLLDASLATTFSSGSDMELSGGSVLLNAVSANGDLSIAALGTGGDAYVEYAEAGGFLVVGSLDGAATLRGATAVDGIQLFAFGTVTLGADSKALITSGNTASILGGGCGCGPGDITVVSQDGDVRVNLYSVDGVFDAIAAGIDGDVQIALMFGDLTIADLAGYNIDVDVENGTLETGYGDPLTYGVFVSGGDYSIKATDFLGNALTPNLPFGAMNNYTVIDTVGGLDMTGVSVSAQGDILIDVRGNNALTGDVQFDADGNVTITAVGGIQVDTITAGENVVLTANNANVDVATSVTVDGDYDLTGRDFSTAALSPLGSKAGTWTIRDLAGDLDYSAVNLTWGGDIDIGSAGLLVGGDITSTDGDILVQANGGINTGALSAVNGTIDAYGYGAAGVTVGSATALDDIYIYTNNGDAVLGAAALLGTGPNQLIIHVDAGTGNAVFGGLTTSGITGANIFTSAGSSTTSSISSSGGSAFVNLDRSSDITSIYAARDVGVMVNNYDFKVGSITASAGRVDVEGPDGSLSIGAISAATDAWISGNDITLNAATTNGGLTVDAAGYLLFDGPVGTFSGQISTGELSLTAGDGMAQAGDSAFKANGLTIDSGGAVSLLGANQVATIRGVDVATGGFTYASLRVGGVDIAGAINAAGQTVDLRILNGPLTQSGAGAIIAQQLLGNLDGGATLDGANVVAELGGIISIGDFLFENTGALSIVDTVGAYGGGVIIRSGGNLTISSGGTVASTATGDAVVLAANGAFVNQSGADAIDAADGRWLIYTQAPGAPTTPAVGNAFGGLGGKSYYGVTYDFATGAFSAPINAGNRFVYGYQPTLTVTPNSQTVTYNGQIPSLTATILGLINGDLAGDAWSGQAAILGATSKNVGTYSLTAALGSLLSDMNYAFAFGTGTLVIDPKALTGTVIADDKTYDGITATDGTITLTGVVVGDNVSATAGSYNFADKNAGVNKTVTAYGVTLGGADAGNYTLDPLATALADILRKALTGTLTANGKTYDGTTGTTGTVGLTGVLLGDDVSATGGTFAFTDKNAGVGKTVTAAGVGLTGGDAANYDLTAVSTALADILRKAVTGTLTANNKTYDGTTTTGGSISLTGLIAGDTVSADGTYSFADKTAGAGKTVTATGVVLLGADGGNYDLTTVSTAIADILRKSLTGALSASNKTYDGTATASGSITLNGVVAGDDVAAGGTYAFADKNAGVGKAVTATGVALSGADAANYDLTAVADAIADILRKSLVGTITASNKTYDGTTAASGSVTVTGMIAGDDVSASGGTFAFADKNAGVGKAVTGTGVDLAGTDAANYQLDPLAAAVADILRKTITATVAVNNKTYDGTTVGTGTVNLTGVIAGDAVTGGGTYAFADANAGVGKTVTVSGVSLAGADAANYDLTAPASTAIADILRRQVAIRADDKTKLFGQLDPAFTFRITSGSLVSGDGFTGSLAREIGDTFGDYMISQGTVALSLNYELLFTPGVLSIRTVPGGGQDGGAAFLYLRSPKGVGLDWDPAPNLSEGPSCLEDCPADEADAGGVIDPEPRSQTVAMLGWRRFLPGALMGAKVSTD